MHLDGSQFVSMAAAAVVVFVCRWLLAMSLAVVLVSMVHLGLGGTFGFLPAADAAVAAAAAATVVSAPLRYT